MALSRISLEPDSYYHIFNHAIGDENLFREQKNYPFFLSKIEKWISPICDLHAYCLMPNHFHLLLRTKTYNFLETLWFEKIFMRMQKLMPKFLESQINGPHDLETQARILAAAIVDKLINEQFSHCFNSYVQSFNSHYCRTGSLMRESFKRIQIDSDEYLKNAICYIHNNPVIHGFANKPEEWKYSSYENLILGQPDLVQKEEVIQLFGDMENFIYAHKEHLLNHA